MAHQTASNGRAQQTTCALHVMAISSLGSAVTVPAVSAGSPPVTGRPEHLLAFATSTRPPPNAHACSRRTPQIPIWADARKQASLSDATLQTSHEATLSGPSQQSQYTPLPRPTIAPLSRPILAQPTAAIASLSGVTATQERTETRTATRTLLNPGDTNSPEERLLAITISSPLNLDGLTVWAQVPP